MLEDLSIDTFAPRLGETFRLRDGDIDIPLRLEQVSGGGEPIIAGGRAPFAMEFRGPPEPIMPQRIYRLEHDGLGSLEIFLVPLTPDAAGSRYEAVFS